MFCPFPFQVLTRLYTFSKIYPFYSSVVMVDDAIMEKKGGLSRSVLYKKNPYWFSEESRVSRIYC
jgi:hypothetical protein